MTRPRLLVSACMLGSPVRYDGSARTLVSVHLARWTHEARVVPVCPEVMAGLPTPRAAAEIAHGRGGADVIDGDASIIESDGTDVSEIYVRGAKLALQQAITHGCRYALLTNGSPSCGGSFIHDGTFTGRRIPGEGVAAALLRRHDIRVFTSADIALLAGLMDLPDVV